MINLVWVYDSPIYCTFMLLFRCFYLHFIAAMHASLVSLLVKVDGGSCGQWNTFKYGVYTRWYKQSFRASNSPGFSSQFLYKATTNGILLKESASLPRNYLVFKSLILFCRQVEKRCSQSTLIFLHAEKLLLTWHFLTRKGENKNREEKKTTMVKVKHKRTQKRYITMLALSFLWIHPTLACAIIWNIAFPNTSLLLLSLPVSHTHKRYEWKWKPWQHQSPH